jgi:hypothetical protein
MHSPLFLREFPLCLSIAACPIRLMVETSATVNAERVKPGAY